ncbi:MAG: hypothetical protein HY033_06920 [Ignavibacteriae bacterium]|nr:hypothetical protein [Ignavibacteria bacterium]MBI3364624.1 hypothetical protein [Ignavibacteriota bacterium]
MPRVKEAQVLYDIKGRKTHVVLPYELYAEMLERLEDTEDLRLMKEAETDEPNIPWEEVKKRLHRKEAHR